MLLVKLLGGGVSLRPCVQMGHDISGLTWPCLFLADRGNLSLDVPRIPGTRELA